MDRLCNSLLSNLQLQETSMVLVHIDLAFDNHTEHYL